MLMHTANTFSNRLHTLWEQIKQINYWQTWEILAKTKTTILSWNVANPVPDVTDENKQK